MEPPRLQDAISWFKATLTNAAVDGRREPVEPDPAPTTVVRVPAERADRRPQLLEALGDADLSRSELAARSGLSDQVVSRWLRILRDEGRVETVGSASPRSRRTRYRRSRPRPS